MLKELSIKNFAIIDDLKIEFTKGLNLLTGETGSGKSIIIEALGIVLGGRGNKDLIRTGSEKTIIEALFFIDEGLKGILSEMDIEEEDFLIITKEISRSSPSLSRINGRPVTINVLSSITAKLVDIFGQHEHQSLLNIANHQILIDSFGDKDHKMLLNKISETYGLYSEEKNMLNNMNTSSYEREREMDLLKFQIDEINEAHLTDADDNDIENEFNKFSNIKDIIASLGEIVEILSISDYEASSILQMLDRVIHLLNTIIGFDKNLDQYLTRLSDARFELHDMTNELSNYLEKLDLNEERLVFLEERLNLVNKLKKKYGSNVESIHEYRDKIKEQYEKLINYEKEIERINKKIENLELIIHEDSKVLSKKRKIIAESLEERLSQELKELNMNNVVFRVRFEEKKECSFNGIDNIEFLISTNPGEELKPLSRIVSGGEMSRIMLAFKSIIADNDRMPTLIFDEIDTGISGRTAQIVGEKISKISKSHQVISISHLPQIAALADSHYVISKNINNKKAITKIERLSDEERVVEMARLLGGVDVTETTLKHAKEMIEMSKRIKIK
ncbi:DNA repair protein RecN [Tissierella creatinini]|nr:DNA repair protein RecN [Tissierella creatinini]TJX69100.1 DNA repair protein RecN [Soehngenia saccharolytica]